MLIALPLHLIFMRHRLLFLCVFFMPLASQAQRANDFEIAEALFQAGNYEKAAELFEKLYQTNATQIFVVERLRESWFQLRAFDKLIPFLQKELAREKSGGATIAMKLQLAQCFLEKNEREKADAVLNNLCDGRSTLAQFRSVIFALQRGKFYEYVVKTAQQARQVFGNQMLFADESAEAFVLLGRYKDATDEFLKVLRDDVADFGKVQAQILSYASKSNPTVLKETLAAMEQARDRFPASTLGRQFLSQLLTQLYIESGNIEGAFEETAARDKFMGARGAQLLGFARTALDQKEVSIARRAYQKIIADAEDVAFVQRAKLGLARVLEREADLQPASRNEKLQQAVNAYRDYEQTYRLTMEMPDVLLSWATLEFQKLGNLDAATVTAKRLLERFYESQPARAAEVLLAKIKLEKNEFNGLAQSLTTLANHPNASPEIRAEAAFTLARVQFYEHRFEEALKTVSDVDVARNAGNDALELRLSLIEAFGDTARNPASLESLKSYADAMRLIAQKKFVDAKAMLEAMRALFPTSKLLDDALMQKGRLDEKTSPAQAAQTYDDLVKAYPKSFYADRALWRLADLSETELKDKAKAADAYERLLRDYPRSFHAKDARERLRKLKETS